MKRLFILLSMVLLLTACTEGGASEENKHDKIFEHYNTLSMFSTTASVTAQSPDRSTAFVFEFSSSGGTASLKLTAPAEIEGITVMLDQNGAVVGYEGVSIETGSLDGASVSPAEMLPMLLYMWQSGAPSETGSEKIGEVECLSAAWMSGGATWRTWFAADDYRPIAAEVVENETRTLFCVFS